MDGLGMVRGSIKVKTLDVLLSFTCVRPKHAFKKKRWVVETGAFTLAITDCQMILWTKTTFQYCGPKTGDALHL